MKSHYDLVTETISEIIRLPRTLFSEAAGFIQIKREDITFVIGKIKRKKLHLDELENCNYLVEKVGVLVDTLNKVLHDKIPAHNALLDVEGALDSINRAYRSKFKSTAQEF